MIDGSIPTPSGAIAGQVINGRYLIREPLGSGATGFVLLAVDTLLGNSPTAIKLLYPHLLADQRSFQRFRTETSITFELAHPNIVQTYSFDESPAHGFFLTMEYLPRGSLFQHLAEISGSNLNTAALLARLNMIVNGLRYAHRRGVIHRDIKPHNILIGEHERLKIADFGLSHMRLQSASATRVGDVLGTPRYMSPEQLESRPLDFRSDIYSFGITAFELATGQVPFEANSLFELAQQHMERELPSVTGYTDRCPPWLDQFLARCSAKNPDDRFQTFDEVADCLREHSQETWVDVSSAEIGNRFDDNHRMRRLSVELRNRLRALAVFMAVIVTFGTVILTARFHGPVQRRLAAVLLKAERNWHVPMEWLRPSTGIKVRWDEEANASDFFDMTKSRSHIFPLLDAGMSPNFFRQYEGHRLTPLHLWVTFADGTQRRVVNHLLQSGADVTARSDEGMTPLHVAAKSGDGISMAMLLDAGAEINAQDNYGMTALHYILHRGDVNGVKILIDRGADPAIKNGHDLSAEQLVDQLRVTEPRKLELRRILKRKTSANQSKNGRIVRSAFR